MTITKNTSTVQSKHKFVQQGAKIPRGYEMASSGRIVKKAPKSKERALGEDVDLVESPDLEFNRVHKRMTIDKIAEMQKAGKDVSALKLKLARHIAAISAAKRGINIKALRREEVELNEMNPSTMAMIRMSNGEKTHVGDYDKKKKPLVTHKSGCAYNYGCGLKESIIHINPKKEDKTSGAHKVMTADEYKKTKRSLPKHELMHDVDGFGNVGIKYVPENTELSEDSVQNAASAITKAGHYGVQHKDITTFADGSAVAWNQRTNNYHSVNKNGEVRKHSTHKDALSAIKEENMNEDKLPNTTGSTAIRPKTVVTADALENIRKWAPKADDKSANSNAVDSNYDYIKDGNVDGNMNKLAGWVPSYAKGGVKLAGKEVDGTADNKNTLQKKSPGIITRLSARLVGTKLDKNGKAKVREETELDEVNHHTNLPPHPSVKNYTDKEAEAGRNKLVAAIDRKKASYYGKQSHPDDLHDNDTPRNNRKFRQQEMGEDVNLEEGWVDNVDKIQVHHHGPSGAGVTVNIGTTKSTEHFADKHAARKYAKELHSANGKIASYEDHTK